MIFVRSKRLFDSIGGYFRSPFQLSEAMIRLRLALFSVVLLAVTDVGCMLSPHPSPDGHSGGELPQLENPLFVPVADREFVWSQIVDTIDNYFKIKREERVRLIGDTPLEGHIETYPVEGSTILEPWRKDSTRGFEKLHATLQSVRRYAFVRVIPANGGYLLQVAVHKQLEDVAQPEHATVGQAAVRHDGSLVRNEQSALVAPSTLDWISIGRDVSLEQRILGEIQRRLAS